MKPRFVDRLQAGVLSKGPLCVGLDPVFERLPSELRENQRSRGEQARACGRFSRQVVDAVKDLVAVVKVQVAYFEFFGVAGYRELEETVRHARECGLLVISDCKRGDIGSTMRAYADYHLHFLGADAMTINTYMGSDVLESLSPYIQEGRGAFMLVRTSNPGAEQVQGGMEQNQPLYRRMARLACDWQIEYRQGEFPYLPAGVVAGATAPDDLAEIRASFPELFLLIPGFGHQGGTANDVAAAFDEHGGGAVVNSSRSVIYAFAGKHEFAPGGWQHVVRREAEYSQQQLLLAAQSAKS